MAEAAVSEALAVTSANHQDPVGIQAVQQANLVASSAVVLDRANLAFFADMITAADLIPYDKNVDKGVQKFRVMAKIVAGVGHDFDPVSSQENFHVIQGRCVLSARGMAIKLRRTGRYDTRVERLDKDGCKLAVLERNDEGKLILKGHVEFTRDHADKAGLLKSNASMYDKWAEDMFYANAIKRVCRRFAPETLDTKPVLYDTAKRPSELTPPADDPPPPQQLNGADIPEAKETDSLGMETPSAAVGQEYQDQVYGESTDTVDADFTPAAEEKEYKVEIDPNESQLADLQLAAREKFGELTGDAKTKAVKFLGSKAINDLDKDALIEFNSTEF